MRLTVSKRQELENLIRDWLQKQDIETNGVILDIYFPEQLKINIHTSSKPLKKGRLLDKKLNGGDWKAILDVPFKIGDKSLLLQLKRKENKGLVDQDFGGPEDYYQKRRLFVQRVNMLFRQFRIAYRMNTGWPYKIKIMVCRE